VCVFARGDPMTPAGPKPDPGPRTGSQLTGERERESVCERERDFLFLCQIFYFLKT